MSHEASFLFHPVSIAWSFGIGNLIGKQRGVYNGPLPRVSIFMVGKSLRSATSVAVCVEVCKLLGNSNGRVVDATT